MATWRSSTTTAVRCAARLFRSSSIPRCSRWCRLGLSPATSAEEAGTILRDSPQWHRMSQDIVQGLLPFISRDRESIGRSDLTHGSLPVAVCCPD